MLFDFRSLMEFIFYVVKLATLFPGLGMTEIDCGLVLFVSLLSWIGERADRFIGWRCPDALAFGKSYHAYF